MAEFRIWNVVRSQEQIQSTMYTGLKGDEDKLMGYWKMDEGMGSTIQDKSSHGNTGTLTGGAAFVPSEDNLAYNWSPADGLSATNAAMVTANPSQDTRYTVSVTNASQCQATATINVVHCNSKTYYVLSPSMTTVAVGIKNELNFMYKEDYLSGGLSYKIYDYKREEVLISKTLGKELGENYYSLGSLDLQGLSVGKVYMLEVTGEKKEKFYLHFQYQP
jgi:hypothetical protein